MTPQSVMELRHSDMSGRQGGSLRDLRLMNLDGQDWLHVASMSRKSTAAIGVWQAIQIADNAFRPCVRLYQDITVKDGTNDQDQDGLSDKLEAVLGTSPTKRDSDYDGIIDGLEVYGPLLAVRDPNVDHVGKLRPSRYLPFLLYGTDPKVKDVIIEWDEQERAERSAALKETTMRIGEPAGQDRFDHRAMHALHGSYRRWVTCFTAKGRLHPRTDSSRAEIVGRVSCSPQRGSSIPAQRNALGL